MNLVCEADTEKMNLSSIDAPRDVSEVDYAGLDIAPSDVAMDPAVPFGGYKMSGCGREGGTEHIESYLQTKGVWIRTA